MCFKVRNLVHGVLCSQFAPVLPLKIMKSLETLCMAEEILEILSNGHMGGEIKVLWSIWKQGRDQSYFVE